MTVRLMTLFAAALVFAPAAYALMNQAALIVA
jgi:hypothetical protein